MFNCSHLVHLLCKQNIAALLFSLVTGSSDEWWIYVAIKCILMFERTVELKRGNWCKRSFPRNPLYIIVSIFADSGAVYYFWIIRKEFGNTSANKHTYTVDSLSREQAIECGLNVIAPRVASRRLDATWRNTRHGILTEREGGFWVRCCQISIGSLWSDNEIEKKMTKNQWK